MGRFIAWIFMVMFLALGFHTCFSGEPYMGIGAVLCSVGLAWFIMRTGKSEDESIDK